MAYRDSTKYERMARLAIDIYIDYNITEFPTNAKDIAKRMGFDFIFYSDLDEKTRALMIKLSDDGVNYPHMTGPNCIRTIYINDTIQSNGRKDTSGFHEIKHIVEYDCETDDEELNEENEDLANFFGKYMKCPIPYLIYCGYDNEFDIMSKFGVSQEMAKNVLKSMRGRIKKYNNSIFDYEVPLLELLLGDKLDKSSFSVISSKSSS